MLVAMVWRSKPTRPYQTRDPRITSTMMSAVKNKDGKAELVLRKALYSRGYRYRLHDRRLLGRPDIVFRRKRVAIFVDGDFWHGRALIDEGIEGLSRGLRTERSAWWIEKITKTLERDNKVTTELGKQGWLVLRFWESDVLADLESALCRIESLLR